MSGEKRTAEEVVINQETFDFQKEKHIVLTDILAKKTKLLQDLGLGLVSEPQDLIEKTMRVVDFFDISEDIFLCENGRIRPFLLLGAIDQWMQSQNLDEKKGLFDVIKILCYDKANNVGSYTFSRRVAKQEDSDNRLGYEFTGSPRSLNSSVWKEMNEYARLHEDIEATNRLANELSITLGEQSPLSAIRKRLGVTVYNEAPFNVVVLKKTAEEMFEDLDGTLAFFSRRSLCVPSDFDLHMVEHEYIHSQQNNFRLGPNGSLGRGLIEAWTEYQTDAPVYYEDQRNTLSVVYNHLPEILKVLRQQDVDRSAGAVDSLYFHLLSRFGTDGLLSLLRMASGSECAEDSPEYHGKYVFIPAEAVPDILDQSVVDGPIENRVAQLSNKTEANEDDISLYELKRKKAEAEGNFKEEAEMSKHIAKIELLRFFSGDVDTQEGDRNFRLAYTLYLEQYLKDPDLADVFVSEIQKRYSNDSHSFSELTAEVLLDVFDDKDLYGSFQGLIIALKRSAGRDLSWVEAFEAEVNSHLFERTINMKVAYLEMSRIYFKYRDIPESERDQEMVIKFHKVAEKIVQTELRDLDVLFMSKIIRFVATGVGVPDIQKAEVYKKLLQLLATGEKFLEEYGHTLDEFDTEDTQNAFKRTRDLLFSDFWAEVA